MDKNQEENLIIAAQQLMQEAYFSAECAKKSILSAITEVSELSQKMIDECLSAIIQEFSLATQRAIEIVGKLVDNISESDKARFIESYTKWGELGWTPFPSKGQRIFYTLPENGPYPDKELLEFYSTLKVEKLFEILKAKIPNNPDLISAIFCYKQREYKACTLLLFSLIEATLLQHQTCTAKVGKGGIDLLKLDYSKKLADELLFDFLRYDCVFSCLYTIFSKTNDFKNSMTVINRNFVCHGMASREITKKDCIQLFLVLGNLDNLMKEFPHEIPESES